ncbi:Lrp/AsnC family transcriptional regulator [Nanoarchaeota archaeon]
MSIKKLDKVDKKILFALDMDARAPITKIAKKTRLSREVVNYRIKNMEERGLIRGYYTAIDISKLGYIYTRIFLKFKNISEEKEKEIINFLKQKKNIAWLGDTEGWHFDLVAVVWIKNIKELSKLNDDIRFTFPNEFQDIKISMATELHHFNHKFIYGKTNPSSFTIDTASSENERIELDKTDNKLLRLMSNNARIPLVELAEKLKLTPNSVKHRIKRLKQQGIIICFRPNIDLNLFDLRYFHIFLNVDQLDKKTEKELLTYLMFDNNVFYITKSFESELEFEIVVDSFKELHDCMKKMKARFTNIVDYSTLIINNVFKVSYFID